MKGFMSIFKFLSSEFFYHKFLLKPNTHDWKTTNLFQWRTRIKRCANSPSHLPTYANKDF